MTIAERTQQAIENAKALRSKMESLYGDLDENLLIDEERTHILRRGLMLKKESPIFTDEERAFFSEIDEALTEAEYLLSDLLREKERVEEAEKQDTLYSAPFRILSLDEIKKANASDTEEATSIVGELHILQKLATGIGWERYEKQLHKNYKRTTAEIRAIIKNVTAVNIVTAGNYTITAPNALQVNFETEEFKASVLTLLSSEPTEEDLFEFLTPLLYHHRKALEESNYSTNLIDTLTASKSKELAKASAVNIEEDALKSIFTTAIDTYTFTKDKVSNSLTKLPPGVTQEVGMESKKDKKKGKEITTMVRLSFDEMTEGADGIEKLKNLDNIDRELLNAVTSVWESAKQNGEIVNGEAVTTLQTLYRILTKNPNSRLDSAEKEKELADRLMKLNSANIAINAEQEFDTYPALKKNKALLERRGSLVSIVIDRATVNGNTVYNAVRIIRLDRSPLYTYATLKKHIANVPLKLLDTKSRNKNNETIAIEGYLIGRIESLERISNSIVLDTLLNEVGIFAKDYKNFNKKRSEVVKKVDDILAGYVSTGYIRKYEFQSGKRMKYYKVVIHK